MLLCSARSAEDLCGSVAVAASTKRGPGKKPGPGHRCAKRLRVPLFREPIRYLVTLNTGGLNGSMQHLLKVFF